MKQYTVIWEDRWISGSHHHCLTKKTWIECSNIEEIVESFYGDVAVYIFEGFQCTIGEEFDPSRVVNQLTKTFSIIN